MDDRRMNSLKAFAQLCEDGKVIAGIKEVRPMERIRTIDECCNQARAGMTTGLAMGQLAAGAQRQSGRDALLIRAHALRREADQLEVLASCIPNNFPADADEALYRLVPGR